MRRFAEGATKLAAEMRAGQTGRVSHLLDADGFEVTSVGEVLRSQQVTGRRNESHRAHVSRSD